MNKQISIETSTKGLHTRTEAYNRFIEQFEDPEMKVDVVKAVESPSFAETVAATFEGTCKLAETGYYGDPAQLIHAGLTKETGLINVSDLIKVPMADTRDQASWDKWLRCVRQVTCLRLLRGLAYCADPTKTVMEKAPLVLLFANGASRDELWIEISGAYEVSEAPAG